MSDFTTKERKKVFEKKFKEKILPFFENHGFERQTKTSKRLIREFDNELSLVLSFEHASRFGSYSITATYFDEEIGNVYDDNYLVMAKLRNRTFSGEDIDTFNLAVDDWLLKQKETLIPFIEKHQTHKALLESDLIDKKNGRETEVLDLLKKKANL